MYLGIVFHGEHIEFMLINRQCEIHGYQKERMVDFYDAALFKGAIESGIARICLKANLRFEDIVYTCIAMPEYGENQRFDDMMNDYFLDIFHHDHFICENEVEAAWLAALGGHTGIVVLVGLGSIAVGKNQMGESIRIGGWGRIAGDEGGEYWIAQKMLEVFTKASDGRYEKEKLHQLIKRKLGLRSDEALYNFTFYNLNDYGCTFDDFVDLIFEAAPEDLMAQKILELCIDEYMMMIQSVQNRLKLSEPIRVSYVGRIFSNPYFESLFEKLLPSEFELRSPYLYLVTGAALRALTFREKISFYDIHVLLKEELRLHHMI